ncbi:hypothetical protein BGZ61DRAFT_468571 [Ilyonectria robusta]|uniref:uncharacterized protein n=1 Tax=Ilyonectria robusta TaxID=1079257 RepID=UPI001E8DF0A9|nr:uncharacterized protein BGZ61DRAFT_468571 [Ilyonectria robusta]KAH8652818.1 hypothetical protein BGZ61DRAFT_468571 [Ilyonectria robusta]
MARSSVWKYAFIRTSIFFLHLVAPFSIFYSLVSSLVDLPIRIPRILEVWLVLEMVFYCAVYLPRNAYLQRVATHPTTASREDRRKLFWRCHRNIPDPDQYLQKWFRNAPPSEIKRENVKDFFRWAFLNTGDSDPAHDEEMEEYAGEMEKLLGRKLEPGHGNAQCLRLTLDKVEMLHRSLTWYLCVFVVDTIASAYMHYHSFDFYRTSFLAIFPLRPFTLLSAYRSPAKTLTYWYRPHMSTTKLPILFIHGIGIGLYPYINFLGDLSAADAKDPSDGQVGIIAIEIMPISSRITAEALLKDEMCEEINRILKAHGWSRIVLVSHSYGSVVAAHLLHTPQIAQKIGPIVFVDPVSFLLHLPDVAYNFICRKPTQANEHLLSYFGSKDMGVSHTLFRRFFWADNILWKEDIQGHRVTVMLASSDIVVNTKAIGAYLTGADDWILETSHWEDGIWRGNGLDVLWFQDLDHGQVFDTRRMRRRLVNIVRRFCVEG